MPDITPDDTQRPVRAVAESYVAALAELDPLLATRLGTVSGQDRLPDLSPAGQQAADDLARATLARLDAVEASRAPAAAGGEPAANGDAAAAGHERRCARLLRERLEAGLDLSAAGEHLRSVSNIFGPLQGVRNVFTLMPAATAEDWAVIARRMIGVPQALGGYRESLAEGARQGLLAAPRQVRTVTGQITDWLAAAGGAGWFAEFAAAAEVPAALRTDLDDAAGEAAGAAADLRDWLTAEYLPRAEGTPDGMGEERYLRSARRWTGARLDLAATYEWGWSQYREILAEMTSEARQVLPGATPQEAMRYLDEHSKAVEGVEQIRHRLQQMMNDAIADLDGTHFDLAEPIRTVEAMIAPAGSAAAPYYTGPSQDFSRPGRTWLPTLGRTRFPEWNLISVWYHEGVPGHHLQVAQWTYLTSQLSTFQTVVGGVSACMEGWALYAERLMDELGYLRPAGARLGYLDAQMMRAVRVIVDLGMHLGLTVPADSPVGAGQVWTPELAAEFFRAHSGRDAEFIDSEIVRYLSAPGQAISYKIGERAWLEGRAAAQAARGASFDLKAWHMAALSLGSLGLDDLADELARL
ncbi:MAG TPA: DUF885 domain-containing protein [Streptosporangiaceae bacterium]|nr:DUF885 domain-containing protein [Streptosporangiaceae bacterium]